MKFVSDFVNAFVYKSFALCFAAFKDFGMFRELMEKFQIDLVEEVIYIKKEIMFMKLLQK